MKIAFLCGSGQIGGAERSVLDLAWSMRHAIPGIEIVVVVPAAGPFSARAEEEGLTVIVVPYPPRIARLGEHGTSAWMLRGTLRDTSRLLADMLFAARDVRAYARQLADALRAVSPDVVHSHALKMHVLGAVGRPAKAALLWHFHEGVIHRPILRRFFRRWWHLADASVAVSHAVASDVSLATKGRLAPRVVLNGVDLAMFAPEGSQIDLDGLAGVAPVGPNTVRIGIVGTTGRLKGQDVFLRAVARLPRSLSVRAYVVGGPLYVTDGSQVSLEELKSLASELGIGDLVAFTGFVADIAGAMRALDVVVHATIRAEPFGLVIAEAMACGRAVIVSDAGGAAEIVKRDVTALTHAPGDVDSLAAALHRLASDAALRERIATAAATAARTLFDRSRLSSEMMPVYREALAARRARSG